MRGIASAWLLLAAAGAAGCVPGGAGRDGNLVGGEPQSAVPAGPELLLSSVEFREVRPDGRVYRMTCDRARYAIGSKDLAAWDVVLAVPESAGPILVRASRASWATEAGKISLPDGGRAASAAGWRFEVPAGLLDLGARIMTAPGARLTGPGIAVAGDNLVWRWGEGKVTLDAPRSRVEPARVGKRHG